jgi:hypothetical protein
MFYQTTASLVPFNQVSEERRKERKKLRVTGRSTFVYIRIP